jgi:alpha-tubulin suppressor-like RCC1 family protein
MCWGDNGSGQLGDGTTSASDAPVQVVGITSGAAAVATGDSHSCAIVDGQVLCWGDNSSGQLGVSGSTVPLSGTVQAIALGAFHSCALVSGAVWCWGSNSNGQLGNNSTGASSDVVRVAGPDRLCKPSLLEVHTRARLRTEASFAGARITSDS